MGDVIHSTNQRAFVGLPLCRDEVWNKAGRQEDIGLVLRAYLLRAFPKSKRGYVRRYSMPVLSHASLGMQTIISLVLELHLLWLERSSRRQ